MSLVYEVSYLDYGIYRVFFLIPSFIILYFFLTKENLFVYTENASGFEHIHKVVIRTMGLIFIPFFIYGNIEMIKTLDAVKKRLIEKKYEVVEGNIQKFIPKTFCSDHDSKESFVLKGVLFRYDNLASLEDRLYFHQPRCKKGPIKENGQKVKIFYIDVEGKNRIIKMWVKL